MDEATRAQFREISEAADELLEQVHHVLDGDSPHSAQVLTRARVDALGERLRELLAGVSEKARASMERTVGRKVTDLLRLASSRLPTAPVGSPAARTTNAGFVETRPPPKTRAVPTARSSARSSSSRTQPARAPAARSSRPAAAPRSAGRESAELMLALQNAVVVKRYSMEDRYEPGDVIDHATFGRGRVERIQPRSMQVRFVGGMKALRTG